MEISSRITEKMSKKHLGEILHRIHGKFSGGILEENSDRILGYIFNYESWENSLKTFLRLSGKILGIISEEISEKCPGDVYQWQLWENSWRYLERIFEEIYWKIPVRIPENFPGGASDKLPEKIVQNPRKNLFWNFLRESWKKYLKNFWMSFWKIPRRNPKFISVRSFREKYQCNFFENFWWKFLEEFLGKFMRTFLNGNPCEINGGISGNSWRNSWESFWKDSLKISIRIFEQNIGGASW